MKTFFTFIILSISFHFTFAQNTSKKVSTRENMWPLHKGNAYQYFDYYNPRLGNITYKLDTVFIAKDTLINSNKYYAFSNYNNDFFRYDIDSNKSYLRFNDSEYVYWDYNFPTNPDSIFYQMTPIYHSFQTVYFSKDTINYFGETRKTFNWRTRFNFIYHFETFAEGLGIVEKGTGNTGVGPDFEDGSYLINAIIYDSLNNFIYYTNNYKPEIDFQPFSIISDSITKTFSTIVSHHYNRLQSYLGIISDGIIYIDSVFVELFYQKELTITSKQKFYGVKSPGTYSYTFNIPIDTSLVKNGYKLLYKIGAKDKAFFPEYSYSPDSGYYSAEYIPTSITNDNQNVITFFISQNFPNPFNPTTKINYTIATPAIVSINVYDVLGREISTLVNEEKSMGNYKLEFDASNLPTGVYFYQIK